MTQTIKTPDSRHNPIRVMLCDRQPVVRDGLASQLPPGGRIALVGFAVSIQQADEIAVSLSPQIIITDLALADGIIIPWIEKQRLPPPGYPALASRIIVWSLCEPLHFAERCLRAGAKGYACKSEPAQTLLEAIVTVAKGGIYLDPLPKSMLLKRLVSRTRTPQEGIDSLSNRELEIFYFLGIGISPKEVTQRLDCALSTVNSHIDSMKQKLNCRYYELIRKAMIWTVMWGI